MSAVAQSNWFKSCTRILTLVIGILYLANVFLKNDTLSYVVAGLVLALFVMGFVIMNNVNRLVCSVLFVLGAFLLWKYQVPIAGWRAAVLKNVATVVLIYFAPILAMPFFYKPYQEELKNICSKYVSTAGMFLLIAGIGSFFLGFYMSMASLPVIYALLGDVSKQYNCHKAFVMTICAANGLTIAASPTTGAGVVLPATGIAYWQMLVYGGIMCLVLVAATAWVYSFQAKKEGAVKMDKNPETIVNWGNIGMLLFLFVFLCGIIVCIDKFTNIPLLAGVSLLAVPFAVLFAVVQGKMDVMKKRWDFYKNKNMLKNPNTMTIVGIAGFAGEGLRRAEFIDYILSFFSSNPQLYLIFPFLVMLVAVLTAVIGIHPMAMGTTLSAVLTGSILGTTQVGLSMIILIGWSISLAVSPFSAVTNLAAANSGLDIWSFTAKNTWKWALVMLVLATLMIDALTIMGI